MGSAFGYVKIPTADAGAAQEAAMEQPVMDSAFGYAAIPTYAAVPTHTAVATYAATSTYAAGRNYTAAVSSGRRGQWSPRRARLFPS